MEGTSATEAAETEGAESQYKQTCSKSVKTRAQKDAHNARCVQYRLNIKRRREELEQKETKYHEMLPKFKKMQTENREMKMELEQNKSKILFMDYFIQELKRTLETKAANEARMRLIPIGWKVNGRNFSSFDESVEWFASQTNVQDGRVSGTSGSGLQDANEFVGLGATGTDNFPPSMAGFCQPMDFGPDYTNITASAAGPSSVANHDLPFVFDVPNSHGPDYTNITAPAAGPSANQDMPIVFDAPNSHGPDYTNITAPAAGPSFANQDMPIVFDAPNSHGVQFNSAAGSSFGANPELPIVFDGTNNHENDSDLFTHGPAAGFQLCENPSSKAVWRWSP